MANPGERIPLPVNKLDAAQAIGIATEAIQIGRCIRSIITTNQHDAICVRHFLYDQDAYDFADLVTIPWTEIDNITYQPLALAQDGTITSPQRGIRDPTKRMLKLFTAYIRFSNQYMEGFLYQDITKENFDAFRTGGFVDSADTSTSDSITRGHRELQRHQASANKGISTAAQTPIGRFSNVTVNPTPHAAKSTAAENFSKSIKKDPDSYPTLTEDKFWQQWNKSFKIIAMNHGVWEILDPNYRPPAPGTDEHELYKRQSTFLYNVFQTKLKNDIGKTLVTNYLDTMDSRRLYGEFYGSTYRCE